MTHAHQTGGVGVGVISFRKILTRNRSVSNVPWRWFLRVWTLWTTPGGWWRRSGCILPSQRPLSTSCHCAADRLWKQSVEIQNITCTYQRGVNTSLSIPFNAIATDIRVGRYERLYFQIAKFSNFTWNVKTFLFRLVDTVQFLGGVRLRNTADLHIGGILSSCHFKYNTTGI